MTRDKSLFNVSVRGGALACAHWHAPKTPVVIALHGITSSHMAWEYLAHQLNDSVSIVAPDLRGRCGSQALKAPYGLAAHAEDLFKLVDFLRIERPLIAGHSLGAYIAVEYAAKYPDRVDRLLLIDGGIGLPAPAGIEPRAFIAQVLGPALTRLQQTFTSREAYYQFWRQHPALSDDWSDYIERYLDYDLGGEVPNLTPRISREAVLVDGGGPISDEMQIRIGQVKVPMLLVTASRGLLNEPTPLLPQALVEATAQSVPALDVQTITDTNHYTILMGRGVSTLAGITRHFCQAH